jgi:hypothetical protein
MSVIFLMRTSTGCRAFLTWIRGEPTGIPDSDDRLTLCLQKIKNSG